MTVPRTAATALSLAAIIASCFISYQPSSALDKPSDSPRTTSRQAASAAGREGWQLVWSDEFDYAGLPDSKKWTYEVGFVRNQEKQYYTQARKENARVEDDML